jgi:hypothetical protein
LGFIRKSLSIIKFLITTDRLDKPYLFSFLIAHGILAGVQFIWHLSAGIRVQAKQLFFLFFNTHGKPPGLLFMICPMRLFSISLKYSDCHGKSKQYESFHFWLNKRSCNHEKSVLLNQHYQTREQSFPIPGNPTIDQRLE